jgi:hypothetical protein
MDTAIAKQKEKPSMLHKSLSPYLLMGSLIAVLLAVTAGAGILVKNIYDPFISEPTLVATLFVQDAVSLLAAPVLVAAMVWSLRGSRRAFVVWCGVLVYAAYYYAFYVFGYVYTIFYPLYLAIVGLGTYSLIGLLAGANLPLFAAGVDAKMPVRALALILLVALLFVPLWGSMIAQDIQAQQPRVTALVFVLDLCFLLPAVAIAAVQLWQRRAFGYLLSGILLIKAAVSGILLAASTIWATQLGMPLPVEELGLYLFLTIAGWAGVIFYMRHLHGSAAAAAAAPAGPGARTVAG